MKKLYSLMLLCAAIIFATGCSKDDDNNSTPTPVSVSSVTLDKTTLTIEMGQTATLIATVSPENTADKSVTWSNDKTDIATVKDAVVTAVAEGTATITVTSVADATKKATCTVTVEASKFIEVNGVKVAVGNLVADGDHGAKIGTATDGGLYFQFGSLIGWAGGASGDGTGVPLADDFGNFGYAFNATGTVVPSGKSIPATWGDPDKWTGGTSTADVVPAANDPCTHYLGSGWRLPTKAEYEKLFNNTTTNWAGSGGWSWNNISQSATHTDGSAFLVSGYRNNYNNGSLYNIGQSGFFWSASPYDAKNGGCLVFDSSNLIPNISSDRANGLPVRCVQASN